MKLYVANGTRQRQSFTYKLIGNPAPRVQPIEIGGQIIVGGADLTRDEVDAIIDHHRDYGLIPVSEVDKIRGPFAGLCYSIDRPIDPDHIHRAMTRRIESLKDQGERQRKEAALATNAQLENEADGVDHSRLTNLEMSVVEEEPRGGFRSDQEPIAEGVRVSRDESDNSSRGGRRNRGRR